MATSPAVPTPTPDPLEATNPAGPPEAVEQPSAAPEGHDTPLAPPGATQPTAADLHVDNSTEDGPTAAVHQGATGSAPVDAHNRLVDYLATHYPGEHQPGDHPEDTAIRLLTRLGASAPTVRCPEAYCNLPTGHQGTHGWVHVEPR
jgi:hypothetical protein